MPLDVVLAALSLLVGFLAGITSGLFGVGGGIVMVPAILYLVPGTGFHEAKAASLLAMGVSSAAGAWAHRAHGNVDLTRGLVLGGVGITGAAIGTLVAEGLDDRVLGIGFAVLLAATGLRLSAGAEPKPREFGRRAALVLTAVTGFSAGVIAGFFGVGGGIIMVPALVFTGVGMHLAVGTSLVAVLVNAWTATAMNLVLGYGTILVSVGIPAALGGILGARAGTAVAVRLHAERLRRAFGVFLVAVGAFMAGDSL